MEKLELQDLQGRWELPDTETVGRRLSREVAGNTSKIIVLDDDPTGVQTVHGVTVFTDWSMASIERGFREPGKMFFILTNSRSLAEEQTAEVHRDIARTVLDVSRRLGRSFLLVSRGDSTLRGHYPLETEVLRESLEEAGDGPYDGEILCPFFREGGRYTWNNVHYVLGKEGLVPCGQTEFARDKTFGYRSSDLRDWVEEKTRGRYSRDRVTMVSVEELRRFDIPGIVSKLLQVSGFGKVVVNALDYRDLEVFCIALYEVLGTGRRRFLFRTAAGFVRALGGIGPRPLLTPGELRLGEGGRSGQSGSSGSSGSCGLIVAGSHTARTTEQLELLGGLPGVEQVRFDSHLVLDRPERWQAEIRRAAALCDRLLSEGKTVCLSTRRERLELNNGSKEDELRMAVAISQGLTDVVERLRVRPGFLIAKGGITSSDIGTKALKVREAVVAGQVKPGIPVWICGEESKFPGLPYIIFPGNVGEPSTLKEIVEEWTR